MNWQSFKKSEIKIVSPHFYILFVIYYVNLPFKDDFQKYEQNIE